MLTPHDKQTTDQAFTVAVVDGVMLARTVRLLPGVRVAAVFGRVARTGSAC